MAEVDQERLLRARKRRLELGLEVRDDQFPARDSDRSTFLVPEDELQIRGDLSAETEQPGMVGFGRFFVNAFRNIERLAANVEVDPNPPALSTPNLIGTFQIADKKVRADRLALIDQRQSSEDRLFEILAQRRPSARAGDIFATMGVALAVPGARVAGSARSAATTSRTATAGSEALAGGVIGFTQPADSIEQLSFNTVGGTLIGPTIFGILNGVNAAGRMIIGGKPAAIEDSATLLRAEKDLNVVGLLTTGELRGGGRVPVQNGRIWQRIEGVLDNIPIPLFSLAGKRSQQLEQFDNAINQIRAAFPDIGEDQARKVITSTLRQMEGRVSQAYSRIRVAVPDDAALVQPTHYSATAQRLLDEEVAKGARADPSVISFLTEQTKVDAVDFLAATKISGDLATKARVASRAAQDATRTGIDAGRVKLLGAAHFRDLETWARQFPENSEVFKLWQEAKTIYKDTILPFNKRPLAPIFDENGFDSFSLSKALMDPNRAGKLKKLDKDGALGFLFVNNLLTKHTDMQGRVNLRGLVSDLNNSRTNRSLVEAWSSVPDESKLMLNSLAKLVDAAPRVFSRGQQNVLSTSAGFAVGFGGAGIGALVSDNSAEGAQSGLAATAVTLGFLRFLVGSRSGRALLTTAARVPKKNRERLIELGRRAEISYNRFLQSAALDEDNRARAVEQGRQTLEGVQ